MKQPLVSVVVPTKNSAPTLRDCLQSIREQDYPNIQVIVVDNFSSDQTPAIARQFTDKFYTKGPERSFQRNFAVEQAQGEFVCIIDSDMKLEPGVISECVEEIRKDPAVSGVIIPEESFGEGFWAQCKKLERSFYVGVSYMEAARFFRKYDYINLGGYNPEMVSGEDWDLSQRIESLGKLGHTKSYIFHNEGRISLYTSIKKKYYYAQKFDSYQKANKLTPNTRNQTSVIGRYKLFLSQPKRLFKNPILGLGMLLMKTCEFFFGGVGIMISRIK